MLLGTSVMAVLISKDRGAAHQWLIDVASMAPLVHKLGGWTPQNYSMLIHVKTGDQKDFYTVCHDFGSLIPNLGI